MPQISKVRLLPLLAVVLALNPGIAPPLFAQQETGSIIGQLRVVRGTSPPERVLVTLQARGATLNTVYSDSQGRFMFSYLPANTYHVLVNSDDFLPVHELVKLNPAVDHRVLVHIMLTPKENPLPDNSRATASGANPHLVDVAVYTNRFPKPVKKEYEQGLKAEKKGKIDEAIQHYRKTITLAPEHYPARNNLGSAYVSRGEFAAAQTQFEEVIRLNESDAAGYFNLGNVFLITQRYDDALGPIQEGLRKQPDHPFGHFLLGTLYGRLGRLLECEHSLREALRLDPTMSKPHLELVNLYLRQQRNSDAITELRQFVEIFPTDPLAAKAKEVLARLEGPPAR